MGKDYIKNYLKSVNKPLPELKKTFDKEFVLLKKVCKGKKILDVGCGVGRPADKLAKFCKEIICIDNDSEMLNIAKKRFNSQNLSFLKQDALNLNFPDNTFDVAYATYNLIGSLKENQRQKLINEMGRVTKKNGKIIIFTWKQDTKTSEFLKKYYPYIGIKVIESDKSKTITSKGVFERIRVDDIVKLFKTCGLTSIQTKDVGVWSAIIGTKK